jgi:hypothetical protein
MNAIHYFDHDDLIMSSASYYLGRRTAMVGDFCDRLVSAWPYLSKPVRDYIQRIVESEFAREAILVKLDPTFNPFGNACDRDSWMEVRECWAMKTEE